MDCRHIVAASLLIPRPLLLLGRRRGGKVTEITIQAREPAKGCLDNSRLHNYIQGMGKKTDKTVEFDSLEQEVYLNLWRTYDRLRALEEEVFGPRGITSQQYNVLRLLAAHHPEPVPTLTIANQMISKSPDITRMLDKLENGSLILRTRPAENRRLVLISITKNGLDLLNNIALPLKQCHEKQLGHLSQRELEQLASLLRVARKPHEEEKKLWS